MSDNILYDYLVMGFELACPSLYEHAVEFKHTGPSELTIELDNGRFVVYDELSGGTRYLPADKYNMTDEEYKREFGLRLRKKMRLRGFTQADLSDATGISQTLISGYMTGRNAPSYYKVVRIAKALNCSLDELTYL